MTSSSAELNLYPKKGLIPKSKPHGFELPIYCFRDHNYHQIIPNIASLMSPPRVPEMVLNFPWFDKQANSMNYELRWCYHSLCPCCHHSLYSSASCTEDEPIKSIHQFMYVMLGLHNSGNIIFDVMSLHVLIWSF